MHIIADDITIVVSILIAYRFYLNQLNTVVLRLNKNIDYRFSERKLQPQEHPHTLYIQNYSTASATCLSIRRWLFNISRPLTEQALTWIFWQTVDEVNRGHITAGERLYQLKALQETSRKHEVKKRWPLVNQIKLCLNPLRVISDWLNLLV